MMTLPYFFLKFFGQAETRLPFLKKRKRKNFCAVRIRPKIFCLPLRRRMLRSAGVFLFCSRNYRLYIFNPNLRRFTRHLKILPSPAFICHSPPRGDGGDGGVRPVLILKAQYKNQKEKEKDEREASLFRSLSSH